MKNCDFPMKHGDFHRFFTLTSWVCTIPGPQSWEKLRISSPSSASSVSSWHSCGAAAGKTCATAAAVGASGGCWIRGGSGRWYGREVQTWETMWKIDEEWWKKYGTFRWVGWCKSHSGWWLEMDYDMDYDFPIMLGMSSSLDDHLNMEDFPSLLWFAFWVKFDRKREGKYHGLFDNNVGNIGRRHDWNHGIFHISQFSTWNISTSLTVNW